MLKLELQEDELLTAKNEFFSLPKVELKLEHSLISLSKWEEKYHKPFLSETDNKTQEEIIDYIRCMHIGGDKLDDMTIQRLMNNRSAVNKIYEYIKDPHCATTITRHNPQKRREIVTAEIIYYDMIALNIPIEFEKWHLNRLLTLIQVCSIKNAPEKGSKMTTQQTYAEQARIKAANRARMKKK